MEFYLWGAGEFSKNIFHLLKSSEILGFIDADFKKRGNMKFGKTIYHPEDLDLSVVNVVIATEPFKKAFYEIINYLESKNISYFTYDDILKYNNSKKINTVKESCYNEQITDKKGKNRILYWNNCWFTNVGEAFIDIGTTYVLKNIFQDSQIINCSRMTDVYGHDKANNFNSYEIANMFEFDIIVLSGMFFSKRFLHEGLSEFLKKLSYKGVRVIFLGLGMENGIDNETIKEFRTFINISKTELITTRDKKTYEALKDLECRVISGIDMAFWCCDSYDPSDVALEKYDIVSYNRTNEPKCHLNHPVKVIRPYHFQYEAICKTPVFSENVFISDSPYDYITMYANANEVYTDLVHGTIIALQYGKKVKCCFPDDRSDAVWDVPFLRKEREFIFADMEEMNQCKIELIKNISIYLKK